MTVAELIQKLQECEQDLEVKFFLEKPNNLFEIEIDEDIGSVFINEDVLALTFDEDFVVRNKAIN